MKTVVELLKKHRENKFIPIKDNSSGLTADMEESFIKELLNDELRQQKKECISQTKTVIR